MKLSLGAGLLLCLLLTTGAFPGVSVADTGTEHLLRPVRPPYHGQNPWDLAGMGQNPDGTAWYQHVDGTVVLIPPSGNVTVKVPDRPFWGVNFNFEREIVHIDGNWVAPNWGTLALQEGSTHRSGTVISGQSNSSPPIVVTVGYYREFEDSGTLDFWFYVPGTSRYGVAELNLREGNTLWGTWAYVDGQLVPWKLSRANPVRYIRPRTNTNSVPFSDPVSVSGPGAVHRH